jgi:hypothetical protein
MPDVTVLEPSPDFLSHFDGMNDPLQTAKIIYPLNEIFRKRPFSRYSSTAGVHQSC